MKKRIKWKLIILFAILFFVILISRNMYTAVQILCPNCQGSTTLVKSVAPTCTEEGYRLYSCNNDNYDITHTKCDNTTITVAATGHSYGTPTYTWSGYTSCTAERTCSNCSNVETETVTTTTSVTTAPTCTTGGVCYHNAHFTNDAFAYQYKIETIPATGHSYIVQYLSSTYLKTAATCTSPAVYYYKCTYCTAKGTATYTSGSALGHTMGYKYKYYDEQSHEEIGYCTVCNNEIGGSIVSHEFNDYTSNNNATCETDGTETATCLCGAEDTQTDEGSKLAHSYTEKNTSTTYLKTAATCTSPAVYYYKCATCTAKGTATYTYGSSLGHSYGAPTYTWSGYTSCTAKRTCSRCSNVETETATITSAVTTAATCEEAGVRTYTATFTNSAYATQTKTQSIPATGHRTGEPVEENRIEATCTKDGSYELWALCSVCNLFLIEEETIPATGHTSSEPVEENRVESTCTKYGSYDSVVYCSVCDEELSREAKVIEKLAHSYTQKNTSTTYLKTAATCTSPAVYYYKCATCTAKGTATYTSGNSLGHTASEPVEENREEATCTTEGTYDSVIYCSVCGEELSRETKVIEKLAHTEVIDAAVEATCTTTGLTEGKHCSVCNTVLIAQETIPATGHTSSEPVEENRVEATCTKEGTYDSVIYCSVCGEELSRETKVIEKLAHTEVIDEAVEATCTTTGLTEGKHCSVCNTVLIAQQTVPTTGHTSSEPVEENRVEATCTKEGSYDRVVYCSVCDEEISREGKVIEKLAHTYGDWVIEKDATYEEDGLKYRVCTICNKERQEEIIPKLTKEEINIQTTYTVKEIDNNKYINISKKITVEEFLKNVTSSNSEIIINDKDGNELKHNDYVPTDARVITKADGKEQFTVILIGDINSDGEINFKDIIRANAVRIANLESSILKSQLLAADFNSTNKIEFRDIITLNAIRINFGNY